ncbi:MAG: GIDE domain-containing protein [Syntrophotaleaceae bacterium]
MNTPPNHHLLVVQSVPREQENLSALIGKLAEQKAVDPFNARQRLIGRGPNLLAQGSRKDLEPLGRLLNTHGFVCWIIPANRLYKVPSQLSGLHCGPEYLTLFTSVEKIRLQRGDRVMAVLADLSGSAVDKQLRRQMAGRIYNGTETVAALDDEDLYKVILRGAPVLDFYLFDGPGKVRNAVRVQAGRFDPSGLGERKQLSTAANLEEIVKLVREYAGTFMLSLDFGFANLPGCSLQKAAGEDLRLQRNNLQSLTRFGALLTEMTSAGPFSGASTSRDVTTSVSSGGRGDLEDVQGLLDEMRGEIPAKPAENLPGPSSSLPPPPDRPHFRRPSRTFWSLFAGSAGVGFYVFGENRIFWHLIYRYGIRPGIIPALLAGVCLWGGFYFLRLKRRVENTPTSRIRSLAMGLVEVQGRARRKFALVSPMTHLPCVYYRLRRYSRDRRNNWRLTSTTDSGHVPFYLEDNSGVVTVDPAKASIRTGYSQTGYGGPSDLFFTSAAHLDRDEKWVEDTIPEGTKLYILGEATENRLGHLPLREQLTLALRALKGNPEALGRYDEDGDGKISTEEWNRARRDVEEQLLHQNLNNREPDPDRKDRVVIRRPRRRSLPFILAETSSEAHLVRGYGLYSIPLFAGALVAVIWTVAMLADFLQIY